MSALLPDKVEHIVWHTAAHGREATGEVFDTTAKQIDSWHRDKGWNGIGYHFVVRFDGTVEAGRPLSQVGAHVEGINEKSIGICFSGHGDLKPLTPAQVEAGVNLTVQLLNQFRLREQFMAGDELIVMGHREVNRLVERGRAPKRSSKTCPGAKVDMNAVRDRVQSKIGDNKEIAERPSKLTFSNAAQMLQGLQAVYAAAASMGLPDDSLAHLNSFRKDPVVDLVVTIAKGE